MRRSDLAQILRGALMGGADIVPGVSGGTMALILGIYERLVAAISHIDTSLLGQLKRREWRTAAEHCDLRFLAFLGLGIGAGIVGLASTMHHLLDHHVQRTHAAFFGMILASCVLVARMVGTWRALQGLALIAAAGLAFWLVGLPFLQEPPDSPAYLFACGAVAICAMILPGISGAFILLVLGQYYHVTGILKGIPKLEFDSDALVTVGSFAAGAVVGILSFSRLLRLLLDRFHATTMAALAGFMLGSLRKIWPFKHETTPPGTDLKARLYANDWPEFGTTETWILLGLVVVAGAFVLALELVSTRLSSKKAHG